MYIRVLPGAQVLSVHIGNAGVEVVCTAREPVDFSGFAADLQEKVRLPVCVRLKE